MQFDSLYELMKCQTQANK